MRFFFVMGVVFLCSAIMNATYAKAHIYAEKDTLDIRRGIVAGTIINSITKQPVSGASIVIMNTKKGAYTNAKGEFTISAVPVGAYSVKISLIGYLSRTMPDIIIRSGRTTRMDTELEETELSTDEVVVSSGYFRGEEISTTEMSFEELRRSPGTAGDINRALVMIPSAVQLDDNGNDLIVRGGAPFENGYYLDNMFTPNINHFPQMGASGGNISILNIDFVRNVSLIAGGFAPHFGNRLSSVVDITLRDGNKEQYDAQLDFNMTGFGGQLEGPIGKDASFMISAKRSYLDLIAGWLNFNGAPRFGDAQAKVTWNIAENHTVSLLNMYGISEFIRSREQALDTDEGSYGWERFHTNTLGANWKALWSDKVYSNTSLSYAFIDASREWRRTSAGDITTAFSYMEKFLTLRNINTWNISEQIIAEGGTEWQWYHIGGESPQIQQGDGLRTFQQTFGSAFGNITWKPFSELSLSAGMRTAYFSHNEKIYAEPRLSLKVFPAPNHTLYASVGRIHQSLPAFLLAQSAFNTNLPPPRADHYGIGWQWTATEDIKLTLEGYAKEYADFPLSPNSPLRFPTDDVAGDNDDFEFYGELLPKGIAYTRGVELMIQKKLSEHFYGTAGATYFRSAYRDFSGLWRNRLFDNRTVFNITIGWKPTDEWEISMRWVYAGGRAVVPILTEQSAAMGYTVYDFSRYNEDHLPAYHSLNIRADKRWYFLNTSLITYISVMNVYNRENPSAHYWNHRKQTIEYESQFPLIPLLGVEFEF